MIMLIVQQEMLHAISVGSLDISRWSAAQQWGAEGEEYKQYTSTL